MLNKVDSKKFSKYFLLGMCVISFFLFLNLIKMFIIPIILAIVIAIITYPLFKIILKITPNNNRNWASLFCCLLILLLVLVPLIFFFNVLISQISDLYYNFENKLDTLPPMLQNFDSQKLQNLLNTYIGKVFPIKNINFDISALMGNVVNFSSTTIVSIINKSYKMTISILFDFAIIMFSLFYIFRDGEKLLIKLKEIIPISEEYKDKIIMRFYSMTNATIRGVLLVGILQGFLATMTLWIFGIPNWLIWGLLTILFSVIPFLGNGIVLIPSGIFMILTGHLGKGIAIILISIGFISLIDNVLRPRLIGEKTGMHDLLIFFSIIGGIWKFGASGFILGPIIASVFLAILQIYKVEFVSKP